MNDAEKSAALLRLAGLVETVDGVEYINVWYQLDGGVNRLVPLAWFDLYKEKYMPVAWKVMNWATTEAPGDFWVGQIYHFWHSSHWIGKSKLFLYSMPQVDAQRLLLDRVFSPAKENGMIPEETK